MDLIYEIKNIKYGSSDFHSLIGDFENIGVNGWNLTIMMLSFNRSDSTIRLLKSIEKNIPNFAGDILIYDNNSNKKEKAKIKNELLKTTLKTVFIESKDNKGVAGGRNAAIEYVKTEWVLSIDNDILFIKNPLEKIRKDISTLGCKFLNLPLLDETGSKVFSNGGHLYVSSFKDSIHVGGGSMFLVGNQDIDSTFDPSLGTFLFGGSSIFNKKTFIDCGMFDSNMFIGFEDTDLSMTIFEKGYKIGNCGIFALVHDHKVDGNISDIEYEKIRFSSKNINNSAKYLERKRNIKVWNENVENWLIEKQKSLYDNEISIDKKKPKIALVVDSDGWAFSNISNQIIKNLSSYYDFKYLSMQDYDNIIQVLLLSRDCDLIHFFWRSQISQIYSDYSYQYLHNLGVDNPKKYIDKLLKNTIISTAVYDHLFLDDEGLKLTKEIFKHSNHYYVSSEKLLKIYNDFDKIKKPQTIISDGVDLDLFYPINENRFINTKDREIVVGWVGNSKWASEIEDFKGVNTILKPAIEDLIKEGYPIKMYFADRNERMIPHNKMNEYYSKIDLYICTSKVEGTPNPVLESMACGIPIISTNVGIVPEAFGKKQKQFILKDRTKEELKKEIRILLNNRNLFEELSKENLSAINKWTWKEQTEKFNNYFEECIKKGSYHENF